MGWLFVSGFHNIIRKSFRAFEQMNMDTVMNSIDNFARLLFVVLFLRMKFDVYGVALAYFLGTGLSLIIGTVIFMKRFGAIRFSLDGKLWKHAILEMRSLSLISLFLGLFGYFDVLILSRYQGVVGVGIFSASLKFVWMLLMIPCLTTEAAFPEMSNLALRDRAKFSSLISYLLKFNGVFALLLSVIVFAFASKIIHVIYSAQFSSAVPVLRIMIWYLILYGLNIVFIYGLMALNKQFYCALLLGVSIGLNIVLDFFISKKYGYRGLPFAPIISALVLLAGNIFYYIRLSVINSSTVSFSRQDLVLLWDIMKVRGEDA
jgi:O-antigen/teichoic acid export membrane protein